MHNILVVEDEPGVAESLAYSLRRDGFAVTVATSLSSARSALADRAVELVVLDLMLPDGSGFDLLAEVRRSESLPAVIVLSSRDDVSDRVAALETGADDYVTKPFSPREITARVRAVLRRASAGSSTRRLRENTELPLLAVDDASRRAFARGKPLELTRVEFDLLACLLAAPGRVFTRAQLIDKIWGDGFAISDRTIDSHVKGLRKKVAEAGGDPAALETVRGVGYRVNESPSEGEDRGERGADSA